MLPESSSGQAAIFRVNAQESLFMGKCLALVRGKFEPLLPAMRGNERRSATPMAMRACHASVYYIISFKVRRARLEARQARRWERFRD